LNENTTGTISREYHLANIIIIIINILTWPK